MERPPIPADEARRLEALWALDLLDTPAEERFDRLARLARRLFNVPIALVSLVDSGRQWFKARAGLEVESTPREVSFCGHAIVGDGPLVVEDALEDPRFADNPLVTGAPGIRFYAGAPLRLRGGSALGTLCIIDRVPRLLDAEELQLLDDLARLAEAELAATRACQLDELTGLTNRHGFLELGRHVLAACRRHARPAVLLRFDLQGLAAINDEHGYAEGDLALRRFARVLREAFRDSDALARIGGDDFAVLLSGAAARHVGPAIGRFEAALAAADVAESRGYPLRADLQACQFERFRHSGVADMLRESDVAMRSRRTARHAAVRGG